MAGGCGAASVNDPKRDMDERASLHGPDPEDVLRAALAVKDEDDRRQHEGATYRGGDGDDAPGTSQA